MNLVTPHSLLTDYDIYLFKRGNHYRIYEKLGSHPIEKDGVFGTYFAVWAPAAREVSVVGDFNGWQPETHRLMARTDESGIWEGFIPSLRRGEIYKYHIHSWDGRSLLKGDPYARLWEVPPQTASVIWRADYQWHDHDWLARRKKLANTSQPMSVYEMHLGSWRTKEDGSLLGYRELAADLVPYVRDLGFTHVEFLPVMEHPYDLSWGYQITGYYASTSRFGVPEDFMYLVDQLHQAGIGVILDWVPSHFPADAHGLADFDGTHLYNHADPRKGFHPDWRTYIFNLGRNEVKSFLISNALFWLDKFHIDGFRVDAVASMLYLDYSREEGQWIPNEYGGNENLEAVEFLREFNATVYREYPDVITIAEESTSWDGVSRPVQYGGLGFGQKWMMGWMHDTLNYFTQDPVYRQYHHDEITFSIYYGFSENFMLPLSHDEVVHGKAPLIYKMVGDDWQKFAHLRLLYGYMFTHPGTKLLFMGAEFAQTVEWDCKAPLRWDLLVHADHQRVRDWVRTLNNYYRSSPALYEQQFVKEGFAWVNIGDSQNSVLAYLRRGRRAEDLLLVVCNFTPVVRTNYDLYLPFTGQLRECLNSDEAIYGGAGQHENGLIETTEKNGGNAITLTLPPLAMIAFEPVGIQFPQPEIED